MAKFIVKKSSWYRGNGHINSKLLADDGKRCCIGFVGQQCGISDTELLGKAAIRSLAEHKTQNWPIWMKDEDEIEEAYGINDDTSIDDDTRETQLQELFRKYGDEIEFTD